MPAAMRPPAGAKVRTSAPEKSAGWEKFKRFRVKYRVYIVAGVLAWILLFLLHPVGIKGDCMEPALTDGQVVLVAKETYKKQNTPELFSVVNFNRDYWETEQRHEYAVARVVGLQGDTIEIRDGAVYRNGEALNEPYALGATEGEVNVTLGDGEIFVLCDNRENAVDSRQVGPLKMIDLRGTCKWVIWPLNEIGGIE